MLAKAQKVLEILKTIVYYFVLPIALILAALKFKDSQVKTDIAKADKELDTQKKVEEATRKEADNAVQDWDARRRNYFNPDDDKG